MAMILERAPRGVVFYRWLVSYIVVLLVPIAAGIIIYAQAGRLVDRESQRANELIIAEVGRTIDEVLQDAERLSWQVAESPRTVAAAHLVHPLTSLNYYTFYTLSREFGVYRYANRRISAFYVYFRNLDMVVAPEGVRAADIHFQILHDVNGYALEEWRTLLNQYHKRRFATLPTIGQRGVAGERIALFHSIPELAVDFAPATLVVLLDPDLFLGPIQRNYLVRDGFGAILDSDLEPIIGTRSIAFDPETKSRIRAGQTFVEDFGGTPYAMNVHPSYARDWTYLTAVPEARLAERSVGLMQTAIIGLIVCLVVGFLSAYYQTSLRYIPIRHLIATLGGSSPAPRNEWQYIEQEFSARLKMHDDELRSHTLAQLAHGNITYTPEVAARLAEIGVPTDAVSYGLVSIIVEDTEQFFPDRNPEEKSSLAHLMITSVFAEVLEKIRRVVPFDLESHPSFIVIAPADAGEEFALDVPNPEQRQLFLAAVSEAQERLRQHYHLVVTVVAGDRTGTLADLPRLYRELREAYEYRLVQGIGGVIVHKVVDSPKRSFDYPIELEQAFMNAVKCGDGDRAMEVLDEVYEANFERQDISVEMAKCLVFDLVSTMVKTLSGITDDRYGGFWDDVRPVRRLLECETAQSIRTVMGEIIQTVCGYVNRNKKSHNDALRTRIATYLDDNYCDPGLCTAGIAEGLGMNPAYLTRFFREQTGHGIAEHLTRYRVDRARDHLRRQELTVRRIAELTGFSNANALIRAFKRIEGVTPQQYREFAASRNAASAEPAGAQPRRS